MAWTTVQAVRLLTGALVEVDTVTAAQGIVEVAAGLTEADVPPSDPRAPWLAKAVGYQAAFIADHPDLFGQLDVHTEEVEGSRIRTRDGDPWAATLAPLAKQALVAAGFDPTVTAPTAGVPAGLFPPAPDTIADLHHARTSRRPSTLIRPDGTTVELW